MMFLRSSFIQLEKIYSFIRDAEERKIFVSNSNFELKFTSGDNNLNNFNYISIDNEFNNSCLHVTDQVNNEVTILNTNNGKFLNKIIDIETPFKINFTKNSLFVSSPVYLNMRKKIIKF